MEPSSEGVAQMALTPVLEVVHELAHESATAIGRDGRIEMQNAVFAIRATERLCDRAEKGLGTLGTERRSDSGRPAAATVAKIFTPLNVARTDDAERGIEERTQRPQRLNYHGGLHISAIPAAEAS
jgi:hypothetical protein